MQSLWAFYLGILAESPNPFPVVKGCVCFVGSASCRAFGHTRPASMPGLSVGLPPSPRLGLRPKQGCFGCLPKVLHDAKPAEQATLNTHFQKHIGLSTVCNPPIFVGGFLYYLVILLSNGQRTVFADFKQQYLFFLAGIGIYIYEHLSAVRRCAVKFIAIKLVCACGRHYGK